MFLFVLLNLADIPFSRTGAGEMLSSVCRTTAALARAFRLLETLRTHFKLVMNVDCITFGACESISSSAILEVIRRHTEQRMLLVSI